MSLGELRPQTGLVGLWHLNGNSTDTSGNNNNGTDTAITYSQTNGKFGQGAGFNGSSSKIMFSNKVIPRTTRTVCFWAKITNNQAIFDETGYNYAQHGSTIWSTTNVVTYADCVGNGTTPRFDIPISITDANKANWNFYVFTWDGTTNANGVKAYLNGVLANQATAANTTSTAATFNTVFGSNASGSVNYMSGSFDEISIFNVAKSADWVRQQYAIGRFGEL